MSSPGREQPRPIDDGAKSGLTALHLRPSTGVVFGIHLRRRWPSLSSILLFQVVAAYLVAVLGGK